MKLMNGKLIGLDREEPGPDRETVGAGEAVSRGCDEFFKRTGMQTKRYNAFDCRRAKK